MALKKEGYWDEHYMRELRNFIDHGDEGDVWFGESLTGRIINRMIEEISQCELKTQENLNILDVGCGNAFLLCSIVQKLSEISSPLLDRVNLVGIDYAPKSIELSEKIYRSKQIAKPIKFKQCNFIDLSQVKSVAEGKKFDVIIDKGTLDAICLLSPDGILNVQTLYMQSINSIVKSGSIFILASCNHTEAELKTALDTSPFDYKLLKKIETPTFKFGGSEGSQVCCLVIKIIE